MSALKEAFTDKGAGRLYWCGYGKDITPEIADLIQTIRSAGRQAFYIDTNGFDNVMLSLVKFCFNEDSNKQEEINEILKVNAERKSKVDDNTAKMQSIKQLGV